MVVILSFIISLATIVLGAKLFLSASVALSRLLRLPEMVIGATLVSLATTMPEILVSIFASATTHNPLALGNVVGSGLVNLGLLFGIILLAGQGQGERSGRGRRRSLILFFLVVFVYLWLLIFGKINIYGGILLVSFSFIFLAYTFWYALRESGENLVFWETELETHLRVIFKFLTGIFLLILGARFLVQSGVGLTQTLGIPEIVIGLTLVAIGTSLPELMTALTALATGHQKIALGNLTGATVLTFTLALGLAAIISEIKVPLTTLKWDFPLLLLFSGLGVAFAFFSRFPQRVLGTFLIIGYFVYLGFLFWR